MKTRFLLTLLFIPCILFSAPKKKVQADWYTVQKWSNYYAHYYRMPLEVGYRILENESGWKSDSVNLKYKASEQIGKAGELGPMQVKIKTARSLWKGTKDSAVTKYQLLHDIRLNIKSGYFLLSQEYDYWRDHCDGDWNHAWLMACTSYNQGRTKAVKWDKPNHYAEKAIRKGTKTDTSTVTHALRKAVKPKKGKKH